MCRGFSVATALRNQPSILTLAELMAVVSACISGGVNCEEQTQVNDWEAMFANDDPESPISRELCNTSFGHQFNIIKN